MVVKVTVLTRNFRVDCFIVLVCGRRSTCIISLPEPAEQLPTHPLPCQLRKSTCKNIFAWSESRDDIAYTHAIRACALNEKQAHCRNTKVANYQTLYLNSANAKLTNQCMIVQQLVLCVQTGHLFHILSLFFCFTIQVRKSSQIYSTVYGFYKCKMSRVANISKIQKIVLWILHHECNTCFFYS